MIEKHVFGKGEATLIDRRQETFPSLITAENPAQADAFRRYHDAYLEEYFYILRKIFHTWAFDLREFALDFHEVPVDRFIQALVWLTYVQTIIYELDIHIEHEGVGAHRRSAIRLADVEDKILSFLDDHDLVDDEIRRCLGDVILYLRKERDELHEKFEFSEQQIFAILDLKSADLELLRRIFLRACNVEQDEEELRIFKRIDKIRETFDDIRDYFEDLEIANFNTVICLQKLGGNMQEGAAILNLYVEEELEVTRKLIAHLDPHRREKLGHIFHRLKEEKKYFMAELNELPST